MRRRQLKRLMTNTFTGVAQGPYSKALGLLKRVKSAGINGNKTSIENTNNNDNNDNKNNTNGKSNAVIAASPPSTQAAVGSKIRPSPNSLILRFKHPSSRPAFKSFWVLNHALLQALQFQTLNQTAITKILKKFDKQTALNSRHTFFPLISSSSAAESAVAAMSSSSSTSLITTTSGVAQYHPFVSSSLAKSICFVIAERLIPVTPQIDDFLCPICTSITYKPIRLDCTPHLLRPLPSPAPARGRGPLPHLPAERGPRCRRAQPRPRGQVRILEKAFPQGNQGKASGNGKDYCQGANGPA